MDARLRQGRRTLIMTDIINYDKDIKNAFDKLREDKQQIVMEIVANFHYRNGNNHLDGSKGDIEISPGELNNCLAYCLKCGEREANAEANDN